VVFEYWTDEPLLLQRGRLTMSYVRTWSFFSGVLLLFILSGCSGNSPLTNDIEPGDSSLQKDSERASGMHLLWGFYEITIDPETLESTVTPLRSADFNANVTLFMQPPQSPTNRISVYIDIGDSEIDTGLFAVDISLHHPFPGLSQYSGFDVRGIFMADGSVSSSHYNGLDYAGNDEAFLLNPDGWTRWWNPSEFTTFNTVLGYTTGVLSSPGYSASATLNPYKYFTDGLGPEDDLFIEPDTRGFFSTVPGTNQRRYLIQFAMDSGSTVVKFNYAVDASWAEPEGSSPYEADDFPPEANCQEAYMIEVADAESTAWFVSDTENGGDLLLDITVYDWQGAQNPDGVPGEVAAIWVESEMLFDDPVNVLPSATVAPAGPTSSTWSVEINDVTPSGLTGQTLLIGVESVDPPDYEPNIEDIAGFDYPEEPLAAFLFRDALILDEQPIQIPQPLGLDNCVAAGVVNIFWDPVDWPTLAGYNVYRKLLGDPDFDFDNPLNSEVLTETEYLDTDVLMDGTSYDYVVTAVDSDLSESIPSDIVNATPEYISPSGFTDLDNPDGEIGTTSTSDFVNADLAPDGTFCIVYGFPTRFYRSNIQDLSNAQMVYLGSYGYGRWADVAQDSQGNAHVIWTNYFTYDRRYYYAMVTPTNQVQHFTTVHQFTQPDYWEGESSITVTPDDEIHMVMPSYNSGYNLTYVHGQPGDFSTPEIITTQVNSSIYHMRPDMASDRFGNVHVAWTGPSGLINYMKRDADGNWGSVQGISGGVYGYDNWAAIACDFEGTVHIAWHINNYHPGYANNRTGSWQSFAINSMPSGNAVGIACDPDGNACIQTWTGSGGDRRNRVAIINRSNTVVEIDVINDDLPYDASWCSFAGQVDPCYDFDAAMVATWRDYPPSPGAKYGRIQLDY